MNQPSGFGRVARDILDLCELQMELLSVDSQAAKRDLVRAIAFAAVAATLAGSALTVVLVGTGFLLAEMTDLSTGGGMMLIGGAVFAVVVALLAFSVSAVKAAAASMSETKAEFGENLRWLKATLVSPDSSPRNQMRAESFQSRNHTYGSRGSDSQAFYSPPLHPESPR